MEELILKISKKEIFKRLPSNLLEEIFQKVDIFFIRIGDNMIKSSKNLLRVSIVFIIIFVIFYFAGIICTAFI